MRLWCTGPLESETISIILKRALCAAVRLFLHTTFFWIVSTKSHAFAGNTRDTRVVSKVDRFQVAAGPKPPRAKSPAPPPPEAVIGVPFHCDESVVAQAAATESAVPASSAKKRRKRRRPRCGACAGCLAADCGACVFCLDQVRHGGPGALRRSCPQRKCAELGSQKKPVKQPRVAAEPRPALKVRKLRLAAEIAVRRAQWSVGARTSVPQLDAHAVRQEPMHAPSSPSTIRDDLDLDPLASQSGVLPFFFGEKLSKERFQKARTHGKESPQRLSLSK